MICCRTNTDEFTVVSAGTALPVLTAETTATVPTAVTLYRLTRLKPL